jgi:hypothetical protein
MTTSSEKSTGNFGLLATGQCGKWSVDIDENLDRDDEWIAEIDGPNVYLHFQIEGLKVISEAIDFLQNPQNGVEGRDQWLLLGKFGTAPVSLVWDNEEFPRCFLVVGPRANAVLRLSLWTEDIEMLRQALGQVWSDLPQASDR